MRFFMLLAVLMQLSMWAFADNDPTTSEEGSPKDKLKDTMLFGDVQSEGTHIPFATIMVEGTTIGTAADETGHFKLVGMPEGDINIVISAVGYQTKKFPLNMKIGKAETILAELEPDNIGLEQVVVSADRTEKSRKDVSTIVSTISPKLFDRIQGVTLSEGLNFTPGLRMENNCQNCGFTQVRMNGLEGPYSQILINSRPVFSGLAGVYGLELIPANMIDRVEVVRGGGSALFGSNAIAGTINLITKEPMQDTYQINTSLGIIGDDGELDHTINLNGSVVSGDYRTGFSFYGFKRNRDAYDHNGDGFSEMSEIDNSTFGASFFQRVGDRSKIKVDYFNIDESRRGGNDFEKIDHEADISEALEHKINSVNFNFDKLMKVHDKFSVYGALQHVDRDSYYGAEQDLSAYGNSKDLSFSLGTQYKTDLEKLLFAHAELLIGLETTHNGLEDTKLGYLDTETNEHIDNTLITDQSVNTTGFFAQNEWSAENWRLSFGFRLEHYSIKDEANDHDDITGDVFSPRASFLYNLSNDIQLRTSFAKGYRAPQVFDEDLHIETSGARRVIHENDPDLEQETSNSVTFSIDISKELGNWQTQFLAEAFYTDLKNPFANEYGEPDENGQVIYTRVNAEDGAVVKGINFEFNASPSAAFAIQSGLTIQSSKYDSPVEFDEKKFFRTPDSYGYLSMNYSPNPRFDVSLTGNYTGKMLIPYFGPRIADPEAGQLNESDPFFDLGIKFGQKFSLTNDVSMQLYGGVKNIFNSYQDDFDSGIERDPGYIYGPLAPRTFYIGLKIGNIF